MRFRLFKEKKNEMAKTNHKPARHHIEMGVQILEMERQLQQNLNKIENWATSNGFKFSKSKTQYVHFCQLRKQHDDPVLHLYGSPIPVVEESKFLGIFI